MRRIITLTFAALIFVPASHAQSPQGGSATRPAPQPAAPARPATNPPPAKADLCGCEGEPLPEVLALVGATKISRAEIDDALKSQIDAVRQQLIGARRLELDLQINSLLLEAEAKKRGVTTMALLDQEIVAKTPLPSEAETLAFYNENKERIGAEYAKVKSDVAEYMRTQRQQETAAKFAQQLRAAAAVTVNAAEVTPPATPAERARVFATVGGRQITSAMIEDSLRPLVHSVQQQVYSLRKNQLDLRINDVLLEQESQKRQITTRALLDAEVTAKKTAVTDAEVVAFYNGNKERINGTLEQVKPQLADYLTEQQARKLEGALADRLRAAVGVQVFLREPVAPVYDIATDDQPAKGAATAPVTIVEFTDFQCPACAQAHPVLERLAAEYGDRVRVVVRDYPLAQHANAFKAAEAAEAARTLGKYWEYAALLFANQSALEVPQLKEYATRVGLDRQKFDAMLDSNQFADKVRRDLNDGLRVGVNSTPSIFVNGRRISNITYEGLKAGIDAALKEKGRG